VNGEGRMAVIRETGVQGRMRRRIAVVGRVDHRRRGVAPRSDAFAKDKFLRILLQSGAVPREKLDAAIDGFSKAPSDFSWLIDMDEAVLAKADLVFAAKYGRHPTEDADFRLNGDYHRICRSLEYDLHHYDSELHHSSDPEYTTGCASPGIDGTGPKKPGVWAFRVVLVCGFGSAPLLGMLIVTRFPDHTLSAGILLGGLWLVILLGALVRTLPRRDE